MQDLVGHYNASHPQLVFSFLHDDAIVPGNGEGNQVVHKYAVLIARGNREEGSIPLNVSNATAQSPTAPPRAPARPMPPERECVVPVEAFVVDAMNQERAGRPEDVVVSHLANERTSRNDLTERRLANLEKVRDLLSEEEYMRKMGEIFSEEEEDNDDQASLRVKLEKLEKLRPMMSEFLYQQKRKLILDCM